MKGMELNLPQSLSFSSLREMEKLPWQRTNHWTTPTATPEPHRPNGLGDQLSRPKQRPFKGSQGNTQGFPLVSWEITETVLQLNTHHVPRQVLIAVHLRDAQAERDDSTFLGNNPSTRKFKPKSPTPEKTKKIGKFYCLSKAGNTECLWRKAPRQELAKKQITGIAFIMAVSIAPVKCLTALALLFSYLVYLTFSFLLLSSM